MVVMKWIFLLVFGSCFGQQIEINKSGYFSFEKLVCVVQDDSELNASG